MIFSNLVPEDKENREREEEQREAEKKREAFCPDVELVCVYKAVRSRTERQRDELQNTTTSVSLHLSRSERRSSGWVSLSSPLTLFLHTDWVQTCSRSSCISFSFLQMQKCIGAVCISLVFCALLTETLGMVIAVRLHSFTHFHWHILFLWVWRCEWL